MIGLRSIFVLLLSLVTVGRAFANHATPQAQGIPTPFTWQGSSSSYDNMIRYPAGALLNGFHASAPASLGTRFVGAYASKQNAFGVLAFDNTVAYSDAAALNGLNGPENWNGAYVDRQNALPMLLFDNMTNYIGGGAVLLLRGLNGGGGNGLTLVWNGPYVENISSGAGVGGCTGNPGIAVNSLGTVGTNYWIEGFRFVANHDLLITGLARYNCAPGPGGYQTVFMELNGLNDGIHLEALVALNAGNLGTLVCGGVGYGPAILKNGNVYEVLSYDANDLFNVAPSANSNTVVTGSNLIGVMGPVINNGSGKVYTAQTNTTYGGVGFTFDMGLLWVSNVVANGGAAPAATNVAAVNAFYSGLVADGLDASMKAVNVFAPDNLAAALTPIIYVSGNQPWTIHGFLSGDLTVNGLTGDGITKYLATGINPSTTFGPNGGISVYAYVVSGSSGALVATDDGANHRFSIYGRYSDGNTYGQNNGGAITLATSGNGFYSDNRTAANSHKLFFATSGSAFAQIGATDAAAFTSYPNVASFAFAASLSGSPTDYASGTISFAAVHNGFDSAHAQSLYNRGQTLRVAFGGGYR